MTATSLTLPTRRFGIILGLMIAGIFTIDLLTPPGIADGVLKCDGQPIYEAKDMRVALFTSPEGS